MICFTLFCRKIFFDGIYKVLLKNPFYCNSCCLLRDLFCRDLRTFCVETNYAQGFFPWRKNDKYHVCLITATTSSEISPSLQYIFTHHELHIQNFSNMSLISISPSEWNWRQICINHCYQHH